jgi:hypothetical protein
MAQIRTPVITATIEGPEVSLFLVTGTGPFPWTLERADAADGVFHVVNSAINFQRYTDVVPSPEIGASVTYLYRAQMISTLADFGTTSEYSEVVSVVAAATGVLTPPTVTLSLNADKRLVIKVESVDSYQHFQVTILNGITDSGTVGRVIATDSPAGTFVDTVQTSLGVDYLVEVVNVGGTENGVQYAGVFKTASLQTKNSFLDDITYDQASGVITGFPSYSLSDDISDIFATLVNYIKYTQGPRLVINNTVCQAMHLDKIGFLAVSALFNTGIFVSFPLGKDIIEDPMKGNNIYALYFSLPDYEDIKRVLQITHLQLGG